MNEIPKIEHEKKSEILKFEDFSFVDVEIFRDDLELDKMFIQKKNIEYNGVSLEFEFWHEILKNQNEEFKIFINKEGGVAFSMRFKFVSDNKKLVVSSAVEKNAVSQDDPELKGLGSKLYKCMLDFFQIFANERNLDFSHIVTIGPDFHKRGDQGGLDFEQVSEFESNRIWDKIFQDLLLTHGYKKNSHITWTKNYKPNISYEEMNEVQAKKLKQKRINEELEFEKRRQERLETLRKMADDGKLFIHE